MLAQISAVWIALILKINHMKINEISFSVFLFVLLKEANVYKYITIKWLISQDITPTYSMYAFPYDTEWEACFIQQGQKQSCQYLLNIYTSPFHLNQKLGDSFCFSLPAEMTPRLGYALI